jgi:hypothetical protein
MNTQAEEQARDECHSEGYTEAREEYLRHQRIDRIITIGLAVLIAIFFTLLLIGMNFHYNVS